jgi:hypothetical protein
MKLFFPESRKLQCCIDLGSTSLSLVTCSQIHMLALFIRLIICLFQLVFSIETVFFSHTKSANGVFSRLISTVKRAAVVVFVARHRLFCFLALFAKDSLKYAPGGKISKNGPFSWRHSRRCQDITAWTLPPWR